MTGPGADLTGLDWTGLDWNGLALKSKLDRQAGRQGRLLRMDGRTNQWMGK